MKLKQGLLSFLLFVKFLNGEAFEGYTIFTPYLNGGTTTFLLENSQNITHSWSHSMGPASMPYLLPDSSILYPFRVENPTMEAGGVGGGIQRISWTGEIIWEYVVADNNYQHHHDIEPLPNGNILIIAWERKTAEEAYAMGREEINNPLGQMWSEAILEWNPATGDIVWEWHLWDHLVQDVDSTLANYGVISEHPELMNINYGEVGSIGGPSGAQADWMHINAIDYNEELDQIAFSSKAFCEIYVIDHSATTEEAASHSGGNAGQGGDFLYRYGNPIVYGRGSESDKVFFDQHGVNWIKENYPGEGGLMVFNNGLNRPGGNYSSVDVIMPPLIEDGAYEILENNPFGPENIDWTYDDGGSFYAVLQGGAFRLPNGNTLITISQDIRQYPRIIEVDLDGNLEWEYDHTEVSGIMIPRAQKYGLDYFNSNLLGDVNGDGEVNILDVVTLVNLILSGDDYDPAADINQDNTMDILDVISLINIILAG